MLAGPGSDVPAVGRSPVPRFGRTSEDTRALCKRTRDEKLNRIVGPGSVHFLGVGVLLRLTFLSAE